MSNPQTDPAPINLLSQLTLAASIVQERSYLS